MQTTFDAQITAALFDRAGAVFALGDGSVRFEGGEFSAAHDGAIPGAASHPPGDGPLPGAQQTRGTSHPAGGGRTRSLLLHLREDYMEAAGDGRAIASLVVDSAPEFRARCSERTSLARSPGRSCSAALPCSSSAYRHGWALAACPRAAPPSRCPSPP